MDTVSLSRCSEIDLEEEWRFQDALLAISSLFLRVSRPAVTAIASIELGLSPSLRLDSRQESFFARLRGKDIGLCCFRSCRGWCSLQEFSWLSLLKALQMRGDRRPHGLQPLVLSFVPWREISNFCGSGGGSQRVSKFSRVLAESVSQSWLIRSIDVLQYKRHNLCHCHYKQLRIFHHCRRQMASVMEKQRLQILVANCRFQLLSFSLPIQTQNLMPSVSYPFCLTTDLHDTRIRQLLCTF